MNKKAMEMKILVMWLFIIIIGIIAIAVISSMGGKGIEIIKDIQQLF